MQYKIKHTKDEVPKKFNVVNNETKNSLCINSINNNQCISSTNRNLIEEVLKNKSSVFSNKNTIYKSYNTRLSTMKMNSKYKSGISDSIDLVNIDDLEIDDIKSTMKNKKKRYFKKIRKNSEKQKKQILFKERVELITDFIINILSNFFNICAVITYITQTILEKSRNDAFVLKNANSNIIYDDIKYSNTTYTKSFKDREYDMTFTNDYNYYVNLLNIFQIIELSLSCYFLIEFICFFIYKENKIKFLISSTTLIDVITIFPSFITYFMPGVDINFSLLRIFRIFRVFRVLRIYKSIKRIINNTANEEADSKLAYNPIKMQIIHTIIVLICNFFIGAGLILGIQDLIPKSFSDSNMHFFDALYFITITSTTIGFGDIHPSHPLSRIFTIFSLFYLIIVVGNQINKIGELMQIWGDGVYTYSKPNHIIAICDDTIDIREFLIEIKKDNENEKFIVIILSKNISVNNNSLKTKNKYASKEFPYNNVDFVSADVIDFDLLYRVNTGKAKAMFIFTNKTLTDSLLKEKLTEILILKINRYFNNINIYTQTLFNDKILANENDYIKKNKTNNYFITSESIKDNNIKSKKTNFITINFLGNKNKQKKDNNNNKYNNNQTRYSLLKDTIRKKLNENKTFANEGNYKVVPIMKIKSYMINKALTNPGFLTFAQNLIFNDYSTPEQIYSLQPILKSYIMGIENKIQILPIPYFFVGKEYFDVVYNIYFRSIKDIFTKVKKINIDSNRPILLIGTIDVDKLDSEEDDDPLEIFPSGLIIKNNMLGVFITYNKNNYLEDFLEYFDKIKRSSNIYEQDNNTEKLNFKEDSIKSSNTVYKSNSNKKLTNSINNNNNNNKTKIIENMPINPLIRRSAQIFKNFIFLNKNSSKNNQEEINSKNITKTDTIKLLSRKFDRQTKKVTQKVLYNDEDCKQKIFNENYQINKTFKKTIIKNGNF